jgi:D-arabinose 1-dehydrogenase-like Zn-dependent alcohol dehydrogenase
VVDAVGAGVARWTAGQRVGVGWHGGHCGYCDACRRGNFFACQTYTRVTGITQDGGYAEYMTAFASALAAVPDDLPPEDAAPLLCAGVTTFDCLRNSGAVPGEVVAVLGGLGINGTFMIIGAVSAVEIPALQLLRGRQSVKGWYSGTSIDSEDTLTFSVLTMGR